MTSPLNIAIAAPRKPVQTKFQVLAVTTTPDGRTALRAPVGGLHNFMSLAILWGQTFVCDCGDCTFDVEPVPFN